jgi:hypothetical protein
MMPTAKSLSPPPPPATHPLDIIDTDLHDVNAKRDLSGSLTFLLLLVLWNGMLRAEESCVAFNAISVKTVCFNNPFCCFFFSICYCKASFKLLFFPSSRPYKLRHTSYKLPWNTTLSAKQKSIPQKKKKIHPRSFFFFLFLFLITRSTICGSSLLVVYGKWYVRIVRPQQAHRLEQQPPLPKDGSTKQIVCSVTRPKSSKLRESFYQRTLIRRFFRFSTWSSLSECGTQSFVAPLLVMHTWGFLKLFLHFSGVKWNLLSH